jgi:hypothetical protein
MIYAAVTIAATVAALAAQGQTPSGNYSGLDKIGRRAAVQDAARQRHEDLRTGTAIEVTRHDSHGVKRGPCGMPIIAADASIDPKIIVPLPESRQQQATIKQVEPPPCGPFTLVPAKKPVPADGTHRHRR